MFAGSSPTLAPISFRTDGGWNRNDDVPPERWDAMLLEAFKRCAEISEKLDVRIALDNHGLSTNDGEWQLSLIERVGSRRLGVNLDTMNYRWYGHDLERIDYFFEILAPHVFPYPPEGWARSPRKLHRGRPRRRRDSPGPRGQVLAGMRDTMGCGRRNTKERKAPRGLGTKSVISG